MKFLINSENVNNMCAEGCSPNNCTCYNSATYCVHGNTCSPKACTVFCASYMMCIPTKPGMAQARNIIRG